MSTEFREPELVTEASGPSSLERISSTQFGRNFGSWLAGGRPPESVGGVPHAAGALLAVYAREAASTTVVLLTAEPEEAWQAASTYAGGRRVRLFAPPDVMPFDRVAPSVEVVRHRLETLRALRSGEPQLVVTSLAALLRPTLSRQWVGSWLQKVAPGLQIAPVEMARLLLEAGYRQESIVAYPGEFARRGGILDCYPIDGRPWRAEWDGNTVSGLWRLDPETQGSRSSLDAVGLVPAREFSLEPDALERAAARIAAIDLSALRQDVRARWESDLALLAEGALPDPVDVLAPLLLDPEHTLLEHLPEDALILVDGWDRLLSSGQRWLEELSELHRAEVERGELPAEVPVPVAALDALSRQLMRPGRLDLGREPSPGRGLEGDLGLTPAPAFAADIAAFAAEVHSQRDLGVTVVVLGMQEERLLELGEERQLAPVRMDDFELAQTALPDRALVVAPGDLGQGLSWPQAKLAFWGDGDVFGMQKRRASVLQRSVRRAESSAAGRLRQAAGGVADVNAFRFKLEPGDLVVHRDHGVGRFLGMRRVSDGDLEREYMQLEYAAGHRLYVPSEHLDRVQKYTGGTGNEPALSRLGTGEWERTRRAVRRRVDEIAEELVELYARRQQTTGHNFAQDSRWQEELEASFPYQETRDQLLVLEDIKRDMESSKPMDRLLCGDVGFGKTEIALRAAFKAVEDGRQVALLVPTTVLAQQHELTFRDRLRAFPLVVEQLSRMRSEEEAQAVLAGLASGAVDIVIGTHRLLQKDVKFKNLGLVILDEEQRFGVMQKERLKQLRTAVDVLSLSATPIPRTLHMALAGIRDLSVVRTPPEGRLPIRTYVTAKEEGLVQEVVRRELSRQGQVYYVHNRIQTMPREVEWLRQLVPEARIGVGHGRMDESELAKVMVAFMAGEIDVLCCTTIIESGLDIPNANTLVVDDASRMGLSQLYQLRGRVGRSGQRAYAYFLYDPSRSLTEQADKRLDVVADLQDLGAGFALALKDLEIRGAGNVLGEAQHGDIAAVGLDMYNHLLREAVLQAQGQAVEESPAQVAVALPLHSLIPPDYIPDERLRLRSYQQLAGATTEAALDELGRNLRQRFGPRPDEVENLLLTLKVRLLAAAAGATAVETEGRDVVVVFQPSRDLAKLELAPLLGRALEVGSSRLRLRTEVAGEDWIRLLMRLLRSMAGGAKVEQPVLAGR